MQMIVKLHDKLVCKENFSFEGELNYSKNKIYEITDVIYKYDIPDLVLILGDHEGYAWFNVLRDYNPKLSDYFCTIKEWRIKKLEKLNK